MKKIYLGIVALLLGGSMLFLASSCDKDGDVNIFTLQNDIDLGKQLAEQIASDPATYPVLSPSQYQESYAYLDAMVNSILDSGEILHRDEFTWEFKIIQNDTTLNAFCAPGGYIYVYTGLIKYLEDASQLAGVIGHEIAHADLRHATDRLTKVYGLELLLGMLLGDNNESTLTEIAKGLTVLSFSRKNETESDEQSVIYLAPTAYDARGAAGFFEKLEESAQSSSPPPFLSTHPAPDNRIENIHDKFNELGLAPGGTFASEYEAFQNSLP